MKRVKLLILLFLFVVLTAFSPSELQKESKAYMLINIDSNEILESYNIDKPLEIASTTKLMTFLVLSDALESGVIFPEQRVMALKGDIRTGATYKIEENKEYTIEELMKASIVISGNDATSMLARVVGGSEEGFAALMNKKAQELGLKTAKFYNSTGLPIYPQNVQNVMSVRDLAKLSEYILENKPQILEYSSTEEVVVGKELEIVKNTNPLLGVIEGVDGLKTGQTNKAGWCLVWTMKTDDVPYKNESIRLLSVNMGFSKKEVRDRILEEYANYVKQEYSKDIILSRDLSPVSLYVKDSKDPIVNLYPKEGYKMFVRRSDNVRVVTHISRSVTAPFNKGQKLGEIVVLGKNDVELFRTDLVTSKPVLSKKILSNIFGFFNGLLTG